MPFRGNSAKKGALFVVFRVTFPIGTELSPGLREVYEKALPPPDEMAGITLEDDNTYQVEMADSEIRQFEEATFRGHATEGGDDDDGGHGGYRSSCGSM
jgi:hypothetical protein